jgi:general secretion pathway protein H
LRHLTANRYSGFTLIELLVVIVVMGIALGMVVLQLMPDKLASVREESARMALLLENAGMEARASGRSIAWAGEKGSYRFFRKNDYGDWVRIDDDAMFRPRKLAEGVNINEVSVENQPLKPGEYVIFSAYTYAVPFRIRLANEYGGASVNGQSTGDVTYALDGDLTAANSQ